MGRGKKINFYISFFLHYFMHSCLCQVGRVIFNISLKTFNLIISLQLTGHRFHILG